MSASAAFADVKRMLDDCAKGYTWRLANHSRVVIYNKKVYRSLPKFDDIELGHIRKMVRYLEISQDCAKKHGVI
ncbi:MAG TPA: hypothetical protein VMT67_12310 [Terriglobales bacterium]|nr:hypothetical protein [Terriglobales bacterium]